VSWLKSIKHAFAVDPPAPAEPGPLAAEWVDRVCRRASRYRMTTPALMAMEMSRPFSYMASQAMHFAEPAATVWINGELYGQVARFFEQRGSVEYVCRRLEALESEKNQPTSNDGPR
jgi:hypothetical protein